MSQHIEACAQKFLYKFVPMILDAPQKLQRKSFIFGFERIQIVVVCKDNSFRSYDRFFESHQTTFLILKHSNLTKLPQEIGTNISNQILKTQSKSIYLISRLVSTALKVKKSEIQIGPIWIGSTCFFPKNDPNLPRSKCPNTQDHFLFCRNLRPI